MTKIYSKFIATHHIWMMIWQSLNYWKFDFWTNYLDNWINFFAFDYQWYSYEKNRQHHNYASYHQKKNCSTWNPKSLSFFTQEIFIAVPKEQNVNLFLNCIKNLNIYHTHTWKPPPLRWKRWKFIEKKNSHLLANRQIFSHSHSNQSTPSQFHFNHHHQIDRKSFENRNKRIYRSPCKK